MESGCTDVARRCTRSGSRSSIFYQHLLLDGQGGPAVALVLRQPPPRAFFIGFGDSSINFELRAWTDQFDRWFQIQSELATAVYDAGQVAGISFPFPQREIRLLQDSPARPASDPVPERPT
jgi:small-conductance mechanosensitive channel